MSNTLRAGDNKISAGDYIFYADPSKHYEIEFIIPTGDDIKVPAEIIKTCTFIEGNNEYTINITANTDENKIEERNVNLGCGIAGSSASSVGGDPYYAKYMKYKNKYAQLAKKLGRY